MASTAADGVGEPVEAKGKEKERGGGLLGRGSSAAARTTTSACSACARRRPSCTRGCAAGPSSPVATSSSPPSSLRNIIYRVLDQIWGFLPSSTASSCRSSCHPCRIRSAYIFCYRERLQGFWLIVNYSIPGSPSFCSIPWSVPPLICACLSPFTDLKDHMSRNERPMHRQDLQVVESIYGVMGKQELLEAQEQEQLAYQDKLVVRTKERKNALESYVYDTRNKLSERYRIFATDSEREEISVNLQQTEDWLYEDDDETEAVYTSKLEELKKPVDPIEYRCKDGEARAEATRELLKRIVDHRVAAKSLSASERDAIDNECTKVEMWLRESSQLQESLLGRTLRRRTPSSLQRHESRTKGDKLDTNSSTRVFAATYAFLVFMTHATRVFAIGNISFGAVNFFKAKKSFLLWA